MTPLTQDDIRRAEFNALDILRRNFRLKPCGAGKYDALCPAHEDHSKSLRVYRCEDGKLRFRCYAGCAFNDIRRALGLEIWKGSRFIPHSISPKKPTVKPSRYDFEHLSEYFACDGPALKPLAEALNVSVESLLDGDVGRATDYWMYSHKRDCDVQISAWSFPMVFSDGKVCGLRMRADNGAKFSFTDTTPGLFIGKRWTGCGPILIVEGPTDRAQGFDWGYDCIGLPSCNDGFELLYDTYRRLRPLDKKRPVVILANADEPKEQRDNQGNSTGRVFYPGQEGAVKLASLLAPAVYPAALRLIFPIKGKDARQWRAAGATRKTVDIIIRNRDPWEPRVRQQTKWLS